MDKEILRVLKLTTSALELLVKNRRLIREIENKSLTKYGIEE